MIKCDIKGREYEGHAHQGKPVGDNIQSRQPARLMVEFSEASRLAEVDNLGSDKGNAWSIPEAFRMAEQITGRRMKYHYVEEYRSADQSCCYGDPRKMRARDSACDIIWNLEQIFEETAASWLARLGARATHSIE